MYAPFRMVTQIMRICPVFMPGVFLYLSIDFYGIVAWSSPSIMAAAVGDYVGARKAAAAFGLVTFIFGFGQIIGPAIAGMLAEKTGSFSGSFYMAACFAALAIVLTAFLKKPATGAPQGNHTE